LSSISSGIAAVTRIFARDVGAYCVVAAARIMRNLFAASALWCGLNKDSVMDHQTLLATTFAFASFALVWWQTKA
jgi:hypothetical protein